uniref:Uncharacterized protein n=1 Tax=viral metagenome TaxID=1070528 RepID=A0A6M3KAF2_9ZZZZ
MSSVLVLSEYDEGVPLAFMMRSEKHIVRTSSRRFPEIFAQGTNPSRIARPSQMLEQFDLILSTTPFVDEEMVRNKRLIGAGRFHAKLLDPAYLDSIRASLLAHTSSFALEGQRVVVTTWVSPKGYSPTHLLSLTYDRLMDGDKGPLTYAGSVHRLVKESKLFEEIFPPLLPLLQKVGFIGPLTAYLIVNESETFLYSLSPVLTSFLLQGMSELSRKPLFSLFWGSLDGDQAEIQSDEYALCVSLSCSMPKENESYVSPPLEALPHLWLRDAKETPEGFLTMGTSGLLGVVSARGVSIKECKRRISRTLSNGVKSPEVQYRSDIGDDAEERFNVLRSWGWLI